MFRAEEVAAYLQTKGTLPDEGILPNALAGIDEMAEKVMNYLNTDGIPPEVTRAFCRLCENYLESLETGEASAVGEIKSVSEGSTTITFASAAEQGATTADSFISQYTTDLNRHRSVFFKKAVEPWVYQKI